MSSKYPLVVDGTTPIVAEWNQTIRPMSSGRPAPTVRRHRRTTSGGTTAHRLAIAISQRDDTVVVDPHEARRLGRALLRAVHR